MKVEANRRHVRCAGRRSFSRVYRISWSRAPGASSRRIVLELAPGARGLSVGYIYIYMYICVYIYIYIYIYRFFFLYMYIRTAFSNVNRNEQIFSTLWATQANLVYIKNYVHYVIYSLFRTKNMFVNPVRGGSRRREP